MGGGKSTVAEELRKRGYTVLDADKVVHELLQPDQETFVEVVHRFGNSLVRADGSLDRAGLAREVFGDAMKLRDLEQILHPRVRFKVEMERKKLHASGVAMAFYDVPLLYEKKMQNHFDAVVVVTASESVRVARLIERTQLSESEIRARLKSQMDPLEKERLANFVIRNDGRREELTRQIEDLVVKLAKLAKVVPRT